jgi:hypothetical protein
VSFAATGVVLAVLLTVGFWVWVRTTTRAGSSVWRAPNEHARWLWERHHGWCMVLLAHAAHLFQLGLLLTSSDLMATAGGWWRQPLLFVATLPLIQYLLDVRSPPLSCAFLLVHLLCGVTTKQATVCGVQSFPG